MTTTTKASGAKRSAPAAKKDSQPTLDDFIRAVGPGECFDAQQWASLLGREVGSLCSGAVPETRGWFGKNVCGFKVSDVIEAIRKHKTPIELTEVAVVLMSGSPSEAVDSDKQYASKDVSELLNIDRADIREKFDNTVPGDKLLEWIKTSDVRCQLSYRAAFIIIRKREKAEADAARLQREASRELTVEERLAKIRDDREKKIAAEA